MTRRKVLAHPVVLTEHVFDKIRSIDMALAEFEELLSGGEVIEEHEPEPGRLKELVLVIDWRRPLHVVVIVDAVRDEERIVTVYEPDPPTLEPRLPQAEALMRCEVCENGERVAAQRARLAERDGRIALVLGVPVEFCPACGQVWFTMDVAKRLDVLFDRLLASGAETAQIHWEQSRAA